MGRELERLPIGGLNTKLPPVILPGGQSPECSNVVFTDGVVSKRGGFTPLFKDRMFMNSVANTGFLSTARVTATAGAADGSFRIVPGCLVGGHRDIYTQTALSFDLFFKVGDLTSQHGGNAQSGGGAPWNGSPYTIKVRPILSKGPIKRAYLGAGAPSLGNGNIVWNTTANTVWGTASGSGMPFCLYIFNNGTGAAPVWQFRLSAHVLVAGNWTLQTATSTVPVAVDGTYHMVGVVSGSRVLLRIARIRGEEPLSYTDAITSFTGTLASNLCPIQVFDCPQQFIEATNAGSATQRPGLNLGASADGGYWNACKRAEGNVEDIAVWNGDRLSGGNTQLDRRTKLDLAQVSQLINYWPMLGEGMDYVTEATGRGNHLYFVPRGPVTDKDSGGKDQRSWFFNGLTSYALLDVGNLSAFDGSAPSWRHFKGSTSQLGAMLYLTRNGKPHGIGVEFWVDSIEPQFEQVIAEIHGVLRLAISTGGNLIGYCSSGGGAGGSAQRLGMQYQGPVTSTVVLTPGRRYCAVLFRRDGGTNLDLYINDILDATVGVTADDATDKRPPSGITVGMGSFQLMMRTATPNDDANTMASPNQLNTDGRSGFCGRVESFKIVTTPNGPLIQARYKPEDSDDWLFPESRLYDHVRAQPLLLIPTDPNDTVRQVGNGSIVRIAGHQDHGMPIRYVVADSVTNPGLYQLGVAPVDQSLNASQIFGHDSIPTSAAARVTEPGGLGVRIGFVLAYWKFDLDDRDAQYAGRYTQGLEWRYQGGISTDAATQKRNQTKSVHVQKSDQSDVTGTFGSAQRQCAEHDIPAEDENAIFVQPFWYTHRQRPYNVRSPRELGPHWSQGIAMPLPGQAPVTLIADWHVQTENRRFLITACGRSIYWAKPIWENDGPFANDPNPYSVSFYGGLGSYLWFQTSSQGMFLVGSATKTTVVFEGWVKPFRVDGRRMIATVSTPSTASNQIDWVVSTYEGAIEVGGTEGSGTRTWFFVEGRAAGGAAHVDRSQSLRVGVWNHLHVTMETSGITVRVNGNLVSMLNLNNLVGADKRDAYGGAASDVVGVDLYLGGLPPGRETHDFTVLTNGVTFSITYQSWCGLMSEVRVRNAVDSANWPTGASGYLQTARYLDDANTHVLLHLAEGDGWHYTNFASANAGFDAVSRIREFYPIVSDLEETIGHQYRWLVFRDRLMVTNGESRPQQIVYNGFTADTPFSSYQLGVDAPVIVDPAVTLGATTGGATVPIATYNVYLSFLTADGLESEASFFGALTTTSTYATAVMVLQRLPRSPDPQVTGVRIYVSPPGGGDALFNRDLDNTDTQEHDVTIYVSGGLGFIAGTKLAAPRGRQICVVGSSIVIADLPELASGSNAFWFSTSDEPSYFTVAAQVIIDDTGKPIVGLFRLLGNAYFAKRDSMTALQIGALNDATQVQASLNEVFNSDGAGGGTITAQNFAYGAGDRGVFTFANAGVIELSEAIQPTWRNTVNALDDGLKAMHGGYVRQRAQYWLSLLLRGQSAKTTILVFELSGSRAWTILDVPKHAAMTVFDHPNSPRSIVVLGTTSGRILQYNESVFIDGSDDGVLINGAQTLSGTPAGFSTTTLTVSGANFDTQFGGLAGLTVTLITDLGQVTREIATNTPTILTWTTPLVGVSVITSFWIGGYTGKWSSAWLCDGMVNREQILDRIAMEFVPRAGNVTLRLASARQNNQVTAAFPDPGVGVPIVPPAPYEEFTLAMTTGWITDMPKPQRHAQGHYHRIQVRTDGIRQPWAMVSYALETRPVSATSHAGNRT